MNNQEERERLALARELGRLGRRRQTQEQRETTDRLGRALLAMCNRVQARAREDGWDVPAGPARIIYTGPLTGGYYTVVVGQQFSGPIASKDADEEYLYSIYQRLLAEAGVARA